MRRRRPGARASCFNLHGLTALILISLAIYTFRSFVYNAAPTAIQGATSPAVDQQGQFGEDQKAVDGDGDGVPDWCYRDEAGLVHCLTSDGNWVTVPPDGPIAAPTEATEAEEAVSPPTSSLTEIPTPIMEETVPDETPLSIASSAATSQLALPTGLLPDTTQFHIDNGTKWKIEYVGDIQFTDKLADNNVVGDKCRSSKLGAKVIWNCGDMWCDFDYTICGFAMGPAMYGTDDVMTINTTGIQHIYHWDFLRPHESDPLPEVPYKFWGMDTSNVAAINETHGVAYGYEIWRGAPNGSDHRCGNAVASITLGDEKPIATRLGPLLTGSGAVEMGMLAILRDGDYIYVYSQGGPSGLVVTRVLATDEVFIASAYESLEFGTETWSLGIPEPDTSTYGMTTANLDGRFGCSVYGSVFFSNYFNKYIIICNIDMLFTNMYVSDTPWGPWSDEYKLLHGWTGYGSMAHPEYSPGGSHKEIYFSQGPNDKFNMFKITFDYDEANIGWR